MRRSFVGRAVGILAAFGLLLPACGSDGDVSAFEGRATLTEIDGSGISGLGTLRWDPDGRSLSVMIDLDGVEEGVTYLTVIGEGCEVPSDVVFQTGTVAGGTDGTARIATDITEVETVDLDGGWSLRMVRPPVGQQACGQIGRS